MGEYDWCFIQKKDGMYEQDHAAFHDGGGEGRQMIFACRGLLGPSFGFGYGVVDTPYVMKSAPSYLDFDHLMCFLSTNLYDLEDFDADIEVTIEGEKHVFSEPTIVRVPAFKKEGPVAITRVSKPFCFIHIFFSSTFHAPGEPDIRPEGPIVLPDGRVFNITKKK